MRGVQEKQGCRVGIGGGGHWLCADAKGNGEPVKDFSKSATWLNPQPEHGSGMTPQDRRSKQNQKLLTPRSVFALSCKGSCCLLRGWGLQQEPGSQKKGRLISLC